MPAAPTTTITLRIPAALAAQLDQLAGATGRTRHDLALEALRRYLEVETWQIGQILDGLRAADAGEFASAEEVERVFKKYAAPGTERAI